jgi:pimeloyl-ACP methyl ester carboxylesterase
VETGRAVRLLTPDGLRLFAAWWPRDPGSASDVAPDRALVVLLPGFSGHSRVPAVLRLVTRLRRRADVMVLELRGHGRSDGASTLGAREVDDLDAAVTWARRRGYRRVATLGSSFGAAVAVCHAGLRGGVDAVGAVSCPSRWYVRDTPHMRALNLMVENAGGRLFARTILGVRLAAGWRSVPPSPIELAGRIGPTPLLLVHGEDDHYFPIEHAMALAAAAGPTATVWVVPEFAHAENRLPAPLADRVAGWLVGEPPSGTIGTCSGATPPAAATRPSRYL